MASILLTTICRISVFLRYVKSHIAENVFTLNEKLKKIELGDFMDFIKETKKLWDIYFCGSNEECTKLLDGAVPDCVIIGTGKHEIYHSRDSFFEALIAEVEERKFMKFQYKDFWCEKKEISSDVCLVYGGLHIWCEKESIYINMDSRFTILYKCVNDKWKVVHIHQSLPNIEQEEGEYYPKKLLDLYNMEKEKAEELRNLAENDSLTGLLNYKTFQKVFDESLEKNMWLIVIDIDDFKIINDTYGHLEGNYVLKSVAGVLKSFIRSSDRVCRMGGDEFLVLCKEVTSSETIGFLLDRIKETIEKVGESKGYHVSVSMGAASVGNRESFDIAFKHADHALYEAKRHGKNRWKIAEFS